MQLGHGRRNLVAPLALRPGMCVLDLGCGAGAWSSVLAQSGATVVSVASEPPEGQRFDVIVIGGAMPDDRSPAPALAAAIESAARSLAEGGALALAFDNEWGLGRLMSGVVGTPPARDPSTGSRQSVGDFLNRAGLMAQAWFEPWPDRVLPQAMISSDLWASAEGRSMIEAFVRLPNRLPPDWNGVGTHPVDVLAAASSAGFGPSIANAYLVVAARDANALGRVLNEGSLWLDSAVYRRPSWARWRVVRRAADGWQIHPVDGPEVIDSGRWRLRRAAGEVVIGTNGEDVVAHGFALGPRSAAATAVLVEWWQASRAVLGSVDEGWHQFDVTPRNFVVDRMGEWHFVDHELTHAGAIASEVVAYRALLETIEHRIAGCWPADDRTTAHEMAVELCRTALGIEVTDAHAAESLALDADLQATLASGTWTADRAAEVLSARRHAPLAPVQPATPDASVIDLARHQSLIDEYANSTSWRVTAPARTLGRAARRARARLGRPGST